MVLRFEFAESFLQARQFLLQARLFDANQLVDSRIHRTALIPIAVKLFQGLEFVQSLLIHRHTFDFPRHVSVWRIYSTIKIRLMRANYNTQDRMKSAKFIGFAFSLAFCDNSAQFLRVDVPVCNGAVRWKRRFT